MRKIQNFQALRFKCGATLLLTLIFASVNFVPLNAQNYKPEEPNMKLMSPEFENNQLIPRKFTCEGEDISPAFIIEDIPAEMKSLALIVDDPDAPGGMWVHWVVYNMPKLWRIEENSIPGEQGINDFGRKDYGGPCPPSGTHRYFFKIYALDKELNLKPGLSKKELEKAMQGHILRKAELVGLYKKVGR